MELSVEEKAQRYDEAIEQLRAMMPDWERLSYNGKTFLQDLIHILPELQENEDEMIRRVLIQETKGSEERLFESITNEEFIAWLEKKGEKPQGKSALEAINEEKVDNANKVEPKFKLKPKFEVGDWTVSKLDGKARQILGVHHDKYNNYYVVEDNEYNIKEYDRLHHHWTIQNAKDGDVLSFNDGHGNDCIELIKSITGKKIEFWFCLTNGNSYEVFDGILPYTNLASRKDATPATKEQRDILLAKMKEAGYEWDAEKKELKKIEDEPDKYEGCNNVKRCVACVDGSEWAHIEIPDLKPYWSEEDERNLNGIIGEIEVNKYSAPDYDIPVYDRFLSFLKSLKERVGCEVNCTTTREWSEEDDLYLLVCKNALEKYQTTDKWDAKIISRWLEDKLKSIRPQSQWKPSDEQMKALKKVILCGTPVVGFGELNDLYEQLKKLREE